MDNKFLINYIEEDSCIVIRNREVVKSRYDTSKSKPRLVYGINIIICPALNSPILIEEKDTKIIICDNSYLDILKAYAKK